MNFIKNITIDEDENVLKVVQLYSSLLPSGILERIEGYEVYADTDDTIKDKIYAVSTFEAILTEEDDYTNETTKLRIAALWRLIKDYPYLMIINT